MLYPSPEAAAACVRFVTAIKRPDGLDPLPADELSIRVFKLNTHIHAVFFPAPKIRLVMPFWVTTGTGISSRLAEESLKHFDSLHELNSDVYPANNVNSDMHHALSQRIADLMERAPVGPPRQATVFSEDVYLYPTGMAVIYYVHNCLLERSKSMSKTVMFGLAFHTTPYIFKYWGPGAHLFPLGTEFEALEAYLESEANSGTPVQAVWTEFPSNPLLVSSDLTRLRELADKYRFVLVVDDTIGGFCNIDVLGAADIVVTSLTKSFSGYADVMGGSAVLNPSSPLYSQLKTLFQEHYHNDLYSGDAEALLHNNEDYLYRSQILNDNAAIVVNYLRSLTSDPESSVSHVYYPTTSNTVSNYDACKRPPTPDYTPGYGCLLSVELDSMRSAIAFYNNLHVHQGPHLGAHRTLGLAYVMALHSNELDVVEPHGLKPTQIRISVGLEDPQTLLLAVKHAVNMADDAKKHQTC